MFTGIITDLGRVRGIERGESVRFAIDTGYDTDGIDVGASIACSGACLTVVDKGPGWFAVDVSAETFACTTLGDWREGTPVNLERPLRMGDELGGHLVAGHVDDVARIVGRRADGDSMRLEVAPPASLERFVARKGSVALDGVSLTVTETSPRGFGVNIIPHTQRATTLGSVQVGSAINLEVDLLARYVARLSEVD